MFVFSQRLTTSARIILPAVLFTMLLSACSLTGPGDAASLSENSVTITVAANTASLPTVAPTTRSVSNAAPTTQSAQNSAPVAPVAPAVPAAPNVTCQPKTDWPTYTIQTNDTLGGIAARAGTDAQTLAQANCLANINVISVGQTLYVPSVPAAVVAPPAAVQQPLAANACVARTTASAALYSWYTGTGAYVVTQPPADVVLPVNEIGFNGYVSLTHNGATGWADPSSVALMGDCAGFIPAEYTGCLVWSSEDNNEFNILTEPHEGTPIVMFPGRVWVLASAYVPSRPNDSAYLGNEGWYKVRLTNGIEGWIPGFVERKLGNCAGLSSGT